MRARNLHIVLERPLDRNTQILALRGRQLAQLSIDMVQMQQGDLLVQNFRQDVNADVLLASLAEFNVFLAEGFVFGFEQHDLCQDLIGEGAGHDEGGVAGGTAQVDEAAFREEDDVAAGFH